MLVLGISGHGADHASSRRMVLESILASVRLSGSDQDIFLSTMQVHNHRSSRAIPTLNTSLHNETLIFIILGANPFTPATTDLEELDKTGQTFE